jgi:PAS domain S-box-containing protein
MNTEPPHRTGDHAAPPERRGIDLAPVGMLVARGDGHVVATNQAWSELSGLSRPRLMSEGFLAVLDPAERTQLRDDICRAALDADHVCGDYHLGAGSARRRTRWWLRRLDSNGGPLVVMTVADVTETGASQFEDDGPAVLPIEVADTLILRLNAVAYTLASCAGIIDRPAAARIGQAIADLDRVIDDLRAAQVQPDLAGPGEN